MQVSRIGQIMLDPPGRSGAETCAVERGHPAQPVVHVGLRSGKGTDAVCSLDDGVRRAVRTHASPLELSKALALSC